MESCENMYIYIYILYIQENIQYTHTNTHIQYTHTNTHIHVCAHAYLPTHSSLLVYSCVMVPCTPLGYWGITIIAVKSALVVFGSLRRSFSSCWYLFHRVLCVIPIYMYVCMCVCMYVCIVWVLKTLVQLLLILVSCVISLRDSHLHICMCVCVYVCISILGP
jgi:hypothetical protein